MNSVCQCIIGELCSAKIIRDYYSFVLDQLSRPTSLSFSGNIAENHERFAQAFDIYLIATGISEKSKKVRASVLIHVIGRACLQWHYVW